MQVENGLLDMFLQYVWLPALTWLGYTKKKQDEEINKLKDKLESVDDKVDESKLYSANTYAKIADVRESLSTISADIKDIRELLMKDLDKR